MERPDLFGSFPVEQGTSEHLFRAQSQKQLPFIMNHDLPKHLPSPFHLSHFDFIIEVNPLSTRGFAYPTGVCNLLGTSSLGLKL